MKKLFLICGVALLMAGVFSIAAKPVPIEQKLISIHAQNVLGDFPSIEQEPVEVQAVLLDMSSDPLLRLKAQAALLRYPDMARTLFPMYGAEPEFQAILRRYGEDVLLPVQHFVNQPITSIEWLSMASRQYEAARRFFGGDSAGPELEGPELEGSELGGSGPESDPSLNPEASAAQARASEKLSPEQRGWYAINFVESEGYDFLGQFIVDKEGKTQWVATERVLEGVNQFFTSGIRDLERNYRAGNELSAGDVGWASVDVLIFASAVKVLRVGRAATVATRGASRGTRSAALAARVTRGGRMVLTSARYAKWPVIIGAGYLVISHPSIINDVFAGVAEALGYPVAMVQFVGWLLLLVPVLYIGSWLLWLLGPLLTGLFRAMIYFVGVLSGRRRGSGYGKL